MSWFIRSSNRVIHCTRRVRNEQGSSAPAGTGDQNPTVTTGCALFACGELRSTRGYNRSLLRGEHLAYRRTALPQRGRNISAQGNALGCKDGKNAQALKGRNNWKSQNVLRPFRASTESMRFLPRALPWAVLFSPVGRRANSARVRNGSTRGRATAIVATIYAVAALALLTSSASGDSFSAYQLQGSFSLPTGASGLDTLPDGRLLTVVGTSVQVESTAGSRTFASIGALPGADFSDFGLGFVRVSPDGTRVAIGNGGGASFGNYEVGVFSLADLSGTWFNANHFDGEWVNNRSVALTGGTFGSPSYVSLLDTTSTDTVHPVNLVAIDGIGGASGGIAFDAAGTLYTGNGFAISGPSGTGLVKAFAPVAWTNAASLGTPIDFETMGTTVVDILSAGSLGFDAQGNLFVGGGDFAGPDQNFAALIHRAAVADSLTGGGPVDVLDVAQVRRLDPDANGTSNFYGVIFNDALHELYIYDGGTVFVYAVPEPATILLLFLALFGIQITTKNTKEDGIRHLTNHNPLRDLRVLRGENSSFTRNGGSPFAVEVVRYDPAPGQFANHAAFNDSEESLGPPDGMGTANGNNSSVVGLGGFGGFLVLRFDHLVEDHPLNPMGLDAIVFGNAFWVGGDAEARWAECATIEIGHDVDNSGDIDNGERWFLVPGSHLAGATTAITEKFWDDDVADDMYPPTLASWIPPNRFGTWSTHAFALPFDVFGQPVLFNDPATTGTESVFGYADASPTLLLGDFDGDDLVDDEFVTPGAFYTDPDNPFTVGIDFGTGGGDAFDIAWAIDPASGEPADLPGFNMMRITNAVDAVLGPLGEKSPEIDAVADVAADPFGDADNDEDRDLLDIAALWECFDPGRSFGDPCIPFSSDGDDLVEWSDAALVLDRLTGPRSQ